MEYCLNNFDVKEKYDKKKNKAELLLTEQTNPLRPQILDNNHLKLGGTIELEQLELSYTQHAVIFTCTVQIYTFLCV